MLRFVLIEDLFRGPALRPTNHHLVRELVHELQTELAGSGDHDGRIGGISVTHTMILRWVQHYLPEFEKRRWRYARPVGGSWRMDETSIKVYGQWVYLYRAVDKGGQTVDFFLSRKRGVNAAKAFLRSAMKNTRALTKITLDAM
jgi:hypothetical protein